eukprot:2640401-Pyramimonas_sp.AAC.1
MNAIAGGHLPVASAAEGRAGPIPSGGAALHVAQLGERVRALDPRRAVPPLPRLPGDNPTSQPATNRNRNSPIA